MDSGTSALDGIVTEFETYDDFLDSQITEVDMYYLENEDMARQLVELGYRGTGEVIKREDFEARKAALEIAQRERNRKQALAHEGCDTSDSPFLAALAERELANRSGKMLTIIFVRDRNSKGQEVSGYIDYSHRLNTEKFGPYFLGKRRLLPRPTDLSYHNWATNTTESMDSPNYQVIADDQSGLRFKSKVDRKEVNVDPNGNPGDNSSRFVLDTDEYEQVVFYDHVNRRKP